MNRRLSLVLATALSCLVLQACEDRVQRVPGCETNDDCTSPRMCVDGSCVDPDRVDVGTDGSGGGTDDAGQGGGDADTAVPSDTAIIPDVPSARSCVEVRPETVDLGEREIGSRTVRSVLVENCGRVDVTLQSAGIFDDQGVFSVVDFPPAPVVIVPGDAEPLIFEATPTALGVTDATIDVQVDEQSLQVPLFVTGIGEVEENLCLLASAPITFGTVRVGETVPAQTVTFENCGNEVLSSLQVLQPDNGSIVATPALVPTLAPGETVTVQLTLGTEFAANYLVAISLVNGDVFASTFVTASVIADEAIAACLVSDPSAIDFGVVTTGQELESEISLSNCGSVPVEFTNVEIATVAGDSSWLSVGELAFFMEPGTVQRLPVRFTPQEEGEWSALILLSTDTPGVTPLVVPVTARVEERDTQPQP